MQQQIFTVEGMSCGHCERAVVQAIKQLDSAAEVTVDLATKTVEIQSSLMPEIIRNAIQSEGFQVV